MVIKADTPESNERPPVVIEPGPEWDPRGGAAALIPLYRSHSDAIEKALLKHGAVLFRGFSVNTPSGFARFANSVSGGLLGYVDGNSPRRKIASGVYTSTEYPAEYFISLHNELSYCAEWPERLYFCCITAAGQGGETLVADSRSILSGLAPEIVEEFTSKGVKYVRNLHGGRGYGPSWQDTFETSDERAVEEYCRASGVDFEWKADGGLRLSNVRPAVAVHPRTGERVWFNQADQFHPFTHPAAVYESLMELYAGQEENLPQNACFGDGTPIDVLMLEEIRKTARRESVPVRWQEGDLLVIDNMLAAHGRMPFTGRRKILVSMS